MRLLEEKCVYIPNRPNIVNIIKKLESELQQIICVTVYIVSSNFQKFQAVKRSHHGAACELRKSGALISVGVA